MIVERYKYNTSYTTCCDSCDKRKEEIFVVEAMGRNLYLCPSCLQELRSKIDALSILVQTGIDTKETP